MIKLEGSKCACLSECGIVHAVCSIEGRKRLLLSLEKAQETWWSCLIKVGVRVCELSLSTCLSLSCEERGETHVSYLLQGDEEIDVTKIESTKRIGMSLISEEFVSASNFHSTQNNDFPHVAFR